MRAVVHVALLATFGCSALRTDARIRPGLFAGVRAEARYTPDAYSTYYEDDSPVPDSDASDFRTAVRPEIGWGSSHVELRWSPFELFWVAGNDYPNTEYDKRRYQTVLGGLDLYVQFLRRSGWFAGVGVNLLGGQLVVTRQLTRADAITLSVGARWYKTVKSPEVRRSGSVGAQLAYVRTLHADRPGGANRELSLFVGISDTFDGAGDVPIAGRPSAWCFCDEGNVVYADRIAVLGGSIAWY